MNFKILISIGCIAIFIMAGILYLYQRLSTSPQPDPTQGGGTTEFPIAEPDAPQAGGETPLGNEEAFLNNENVVNVGSGSYVIAGGNDIYNRPPYQIIYDRTDRSFTLSLQEKPLQRVRLEAESALKELLSLNEAELCALSVRVTTPFSVDESYSGKDLGMSFCVGSMYLPE